MKASNSDCYEGVPAASLTSCAARHKSLGTAWYKLRFFTTWSQARIHFGFSLTNAFLSQFIKQHVRWLRGPVTSMNLENFFSSLEAKSLHFSLSQVFLKNTNKKQTNKKNKTALPQNPSSTNTLFLLAQLSSILQLFNIHSALSTRKLNISYLLHWTFFQEPTVKEKAFIASITSFQTMRPKDPEENTAMKNLSRNISLLSKKLL